MKKAKKAAKKRAKRLSQKATRRKKAEEAAMAKDEGEKEVVAAAGRYIASTRSIASLTTFDSRRAFAV